MTSTKQHETAPSETPPIEDPGDAIFSAIGIFLVMILIWVTIKGKLRDWFMR